MMVSTTMNTLPCSIRLIVRFPLLANETLFEEALIHYDFKYFGYESKTCSFCKCLYNVKNWSLMIIKHKSYLRDFKDIKDKNKREFIF